MADQPIPISDISDPDLIRVQLLASGRPVHAPMAAFAAASIHGAPTKTTPVDADEFGFWDSVGLRAVKTTWANIKAAIWSGSTWTPTLAFGGLSTGITYSLQTAVVRQTGPFTLVVGAIILSSKGSATGAATILGSPVTSANITGTGTSGTVTVMLNMASIPGTPLVFGGANSAVINLGYWPSAGGARANFDNTHFNNNSQVNFTLLYISA